MHVDITAKVKFYRFFTYTLRLLPWQKRCGARHWCFYFDSLVAIREFGSSLNVLHRLAPMSAPTHCADDLIIFSTFLLIDYKIHNKCCWNRNERLVWREFETDIYISNCFTIATRERKMLGNQTRDLCTTFGFDSQAGCIFSFSLKYVVTAKVPSSPGQYLELYLG